MSIFQKSNTRIQQVCFVRQYFHTSPQNQDLGLTENLWDVVKNALLSGLTPIQNLNAMPDGTKACDIAVA